MPKRSAGLLLFRRAATGIEVLLVHPGGPYWSNKDDGAWSLPKGEMEEGEDPLLAAIREYQEETGFSVCPPLLSLGQYKQPAGKLISAWAFEGDCQPDLLRSNTFQIEWPKNSGRIQEFPEIDRGAWFPIEFAYRKILKGQVPFLDRLKYELGLTSGPSASTSQSTPRDHR